MTREERTREYIKEKMVQFNVRLSTIYDVDVIKRIEEVGKKRQYLLKLVRYDIDHNIVGEGDIESDKGYEKVPVGRWLKSRDESNPYRCKNCKHVFREKYNYCPDCGSHNG